LTDGQQKLWSESITSWQPQPTTVTDEDDGEPLPEDVLIDGSSMVSYYHSLFLDKMDFNISITGPVAERFSIVILFPTETPSSKIFGTLRMDWKNGGTVKLPFLLYQYRFLDSAILVMLQLFAIFLGFYIVFFLAIRKSATTKLHWFYVLCFAVTAGYLLSWYQGILLEGTSGDRSSFWSKWLPSIYQKLFDILELLMYLLTSLGWQSLRPQLSVNEIQMISIGVAVSMVLGFMEIECGEDSIECSGITSARMIVHMFGYLTIIVAFNYNLAVLREMLSQSSIASYDTGRLYKHYRNFYLFRNVFFAFIVQPTVAVVLRTDIIDWQDDWVFATFFWGSKIALLSTLAFVFRPNPGVPVVVDMAVKERRRVQRITPPRN
jgi:hypothetical protein